MDSPFLRRRGKRRTGRRGCGQPKPRRKAGERMKTEQGSGRQGRIATLSIIIIIIIIMIAAAVVGITIRNYYTSLNEELFQERRTNMVEYGSKTAQIAGNIVTDLWENTAVIERALQTEDLQSQPDLLSAAACAGTFLENEDLTVLLFDSKGRYYSSEGHSGKWTELAQLTSSAEDRQSCIMTLPYESQETEHLVFLRRLTEKQTIAKRSVGFIALAVDMEVLSRQLEVDSFGGSGQLYIVNGDGRRLYYHAERENLIDSYNVLNAVQQLPIRGCGFEELKAAFAEGSPTACELTLAEGSYFLASARVENSDWRILLLVPSDILGADTARMLTETNRFFTQISAALMLLVVTLTVILLAARNARRRADVQEAHNRELSQINRELEIATEEARSASAAKTDFLSNMSHDIRTPINGIMGMTTIALRSVGDWDKVTDCLRKIEGSSQHLLSLINDVLDMSRIEAGKTTANHEPMDLRTLVDNCSSIIGGQLSSRAVELVTENGPFEHPLLLGDALHLRQIFINILGNSVKFTPDGGTIRFRAEETGAENGKAHFVFTLSDTGIGMKPEFLPHLFEAFSQEDGGTRTTYKGTGLGMAITKSLLDMLGGTVTVESTPGVGTEFVIELDMDIDPEAEQKKNEEESGVSIEGMKILLVEDNDLNREIAHELLEDEGALVTEAENGQLALETFRNSPEGSFDAILMDVMMPVLGGYDATRAIRALERADAGSVPIVAMTANAYDEDIRKAFESGMNAHVAKPIDVDILLRTLSKFYGA